MKKRLISALVAAAMAVSVIPVSFAESTNAEYSLTEATASGTCGDNLTWELDEDGTLTISGEGNMDYYDFYRFGDEIKKIKIENGVTSIGANSFGHCTNLTSVDIPNTVTVIGKGAFYGCSGLKSIVIPDSVTEIEANVFTGCTYLSNVTMSANLESIGLEAFNSCAWLRSITIPSSVTHLDYWIFDGSGVSDIYYPGTEAEWKKIDDYKCISENITIHYEAVEPTAAPSAEPVDGIIASGTCGSNLTWKVDVDGLLTISGTGDMDNYNNWDTRAPWFYNSPQIKQIKVEAGVTSIGNYAFVNQYASSDISLAGTITSIGENAFEGCTGLESIDIPNGTESIGKDAFMGCTGLTCINISNSVTSIGQAAFFNCTKLADITLPNQVTKIDQSTFYGCTGLISITIPDSVTEIKYSAFKGCTGLKNIEIPHSVTSIYSGLFNGCTSLENITIPDSVTSIGSDAFKNCSSLKDITIPDGVTSIDSYAFEGCASLKSVTIPSNVITINYRTFANCTSLTSVSISNKATSIDYAAFGWCTGLISITIPSNVTSINYLAFIGCNNLKDIYVDVDNKNYSSQDGVLFDKSKSAIVIYTPGRDAVDYTIPDSVTSISRDAFYNCTNLESITMPNGLTTINEGAFSSCTGLKKILIPDSVTDIDYRAFNECTELADIYYTGSEEDWENINLGGYNEPLETATIHYNSSSVLPTTEPSAEPTTEPSTEPTVAPTTEPTVEPTTAPTTGPTVEPTTAPTAKPTINHTTEPIAESTAEPAGVPTTEPTAEPASEPSAEPTTVPTTEPTAGPTAEPILEFLTFDSATGTITATNSSISGDFVIPDTIGGVAVTAIGNEAFKDRINLTSVTLPSGITSVGHKAFSGCSGLTELILPDTVTWIGGLIIENTKISEITVPASVTGNGYYWRSEESNIANGPFGGCPSLKKVVLSDGISSIGKGLFACLDASGIEEIVIPDTITSIGEYAFRNCKKLTSISIPEGVTSIGNNAFLDCSGLTAISLPDTVTTIGNYAFQNCSGLTELGLPAELESLGARFIQGTSIEEITVPKSLREITYYHGNLDGYAGINPLNAYDVVRNGPFSGCTVLKKVVLEEGTPYICESMFATTGDTKIETIIIPDSVKTIGKAAFAKCNSLKSLELPEGITSIGEAAFWYCTGLKSINIPSSVSYIGNMSFEGCSGLSDVDFAQNEADDASLKIDFRAFRNCTSLKTINLPHHVTFLGYLCFMNTPISSIVVPRSVKEVSGFYYESGFWDEYIPEHTGDNRKKGPFSRCPKLKTVIIEDGMTNIPKFMFSSYDFDCFIENIIIPDSVTSIGEYAFDQCNYLKNIEISDNVTSIGKNAFRGCESLTASCSEKSPAIYELINADCQIILTERISEYEHFNINNTSYVSLSSDQSGYLPLRVNYDIKDNVSITDKKLEIRIPTHSSLIEDTIALNGESVSNYTLSNNILTVPVTDDTGTLSFCVKPEKYSKTLSYARMSFKENNVSTNEMIGVLNCSLENITVLTPELTRSADIKVAGIAPPSGEVTLFINGVEAGKIQANKLGDYSADISIPHPKDKAVYTITAKSTKDDNEITAKTEVTYYENMPELESLTMRWSDHSRWYSYVMEPDIRNTAVFYPIKGLIFEARITEADMIDRVFVISTKNGQSYRMEAFWDDNFKCFRATGFFEGAGTNYVPGALTVTYTLKDNKHTEISSEELSEYLDEDFAKSTPEIIQSDNNDFKAEINVAEELKDEFGEKIKLDITSKDRDYSSVSIDELMQNGNGVSSYEVNENDKHMVISTDTSDDENLVITIHDLSENKEMTSVMKSVNIVTDGDTQTEQPVSVTKLITNITERNKSALNAYNMPSTDSLEQSLLNAEIDALRLDIVKGIYGCIAAEILAVTSSVALVGTIPAGLGAAFLSALGLVTTEISGLGLIEYACGVYRGARFIVDPSGYVYEAVTTNPLEDVTATAYWIEPENIDEEGNYDETKAIVWDAAEYSQTNPMKTNASGAYAWDVPEGLWQVKFEKDGYETQVTDWLPVPPPQTDINIGLVSKAVPKIENVELGFDTVEITFDKYMKPETMTDISIGGYTFTMNYSKNETAPDGTVYARSFVFTLNTPVQAGEKIALSVKNAESYAGIKMADYTGEIECESYVIKIGDISNDSERLSVPFTNITGETQSFAAICAFYDEHGALLRTEVIPDITVNAQETENKTFNINGYWDSYKIFAWDGINTMNPVAVNK